MKNAGTDQPAGAGFEPVGLGKIQNTVVSLVPVRQTFPHLILGGPRLQAKKGVRKMVSYVVVLGWEIIAFWLTLLPHQSSLLFILMHVVGYGPHVVEQFGVDRPTPIGFP